MNMRFQMACLQRERGFRHTERRAPSGSRETVSPPPECSHQPAWDTAQLPAAPGRCMCTDWSVIGGEGDLLQINQTERAWHLMEAYMKTVERMRGQRGTQSLQRPEFKVHVGKYREVLSKWPMMALLVVLFMWSSILQALASLSSFVDSFSLSSLLPLPPTYTHTIHTLVTLFPV